MNASASGSDAHSPASSPASDEGTYRYADAAAQTDAAAETTSETTSETTHGTAPAGQGPSQEALDEVSAQMRDIAEVPAVEVITTTAVHLMSAAAVKCGLAAENDAQEVKDLDEARKLIIALAGLVTSAAPEIGSQHAGPLRDGLRSLQLAFREASPHPDAPGQGPGERLTGPVF